MTSSRYEGSAIEPPATIWVDEAPSTNSLLSRIVAQTPAPIPDMTSVAVRHQTSGRGQRGNSWESEPGKNLTISYLHYPPESLHPADQFAISEATALAVADLLKDYDIKARIKWPNDIYTGDFKICGILIEHSILSQSISHSIIGIGLNVNQTRFVSDAPNPISMRGILGGCELDIREVASKLGSFLRDRLVFCPSATGRGELHAAFMSRLWRADGGKYPFRDRKSGVRFEASIEYVEPRGTLRLSNGEGYAFKEVEFLLKTGDSKG